MAMNDGGKGIREARITQILPPSEPAQVVSREHRESGPEMSPVNAPVDDKAGFDKGVGRRHMWWLAAARVALPTAASGEQLQDAAHILNAGNRIAILCGRALWAHATRSPNSPAHTCRWLLVDGFGLHGLKD